MRLDWTDLRVFLHVCDAGTMTGAAERAHLTLAAVSARIRNLEQVNGLVLLMRHARGVVPTAAGEVLAAHARRIFELVRQLETELVHVPQGSPRGAVLLANGSALARPLWEAVIPKPAPQGPLLVRESPSEATVQALRRGAADVGIVSDAVDTRGLARHVLGPDPLVLVVPRKHALGQRRQAWFADALREPWVTWGEQGALATHLQLRALAAGARISPRVAYPRVGGVLEWVARGLGVTVLPEAVVSRYPGVEGIARVPLQDAWARRCLLACHAEGEDGTASRLARNLAQHWQEMR